MDAEIVDLAKWRVSHPPHAKFVQSYLRCYVAWSRLWFPWLK